jgi:hypothetical protein
MYAGQTRLMVPFTPGWSAPHSAGGETFDNAKTMDSFSFGLLCMWLIFDVEKSPNGYEYPTSAQNILVEKAHHLLQNASKESFQEGPQIEDFQTLFDLTLNLDEDQRTGTFSEILKLLDKSGYVCYLSEIS